MREILEKGSITLPTKDVLRYKSDCKSVIKDIGSVVIEDIAIPSDSGYFLIFYSSEDEEYILGEQQDCFFNIYYDKDLNFSFYTKGADLSSIPKDMRYVVVKA